MVYEIASEAMASMGFAVCALLGNGGVLYRGQHSTKDVEHIVILRALTERPALVGQAGLRNAQAEAFSHAAIRHFVPHMFFNESFAVGASLMIRQDFARFRGGTGVWSIAVPENASSQSASLLLSEVRDVIAPALENVRTQEQLTSVLLKNEPPFTWLGCNKAIRALQIISLLEAIGHSDDEIRRALEPRHAWIEMDIPGFRAADAIDTALLLRKQSLE